MPILGARGGASSRGLGQFTGNNPTAPTSPAAGYHLWLDAANAGSFTYSSGTIVSQWTDRSSNAFTFTTATTGNQPSRSGTQNSKSTVVFDGTNDYLKSTAIKSTWKYLHDGTGATIFIVAKSNEDVPGIYQPRNGVITTYSGSIGFNFNYVTGYTPNRIEAEIRNGLSGNILSNEKQTLGNGYAVYAAMLDPENATNNNKLPVYINGGLKLNPSVVGWTAASTADPDETLHLGTGYVGLIGSPGYTLAGEIAEIITYKSILSDQDRIANINYLRAKWGI